MRNVGYVIFFWLVMVHSQGAGSAEQENSIHPNQETSVYYELGDINDLQLTPDGSRFAVANSNGFFIWHAEPFELEHAEWLPDTAHFLLWSPDGNRLLVYFHGKQQVIIYETERFTPILTIGIETEAVRRFYSNPFAFSQDSRRILLFHTFDSFAELWDIDARKKLHTFPHESNISGSVKCTSAGHAITAASGQIKIWDAEKGTLINKYPLGKINSAYYFSPDGRYFLHKYQEVLRTAEYPYGRVLATWFEIDLHDTSTGALIMKTEVEYSQQGLYNIFFTLDSSEVNIVDQGKIRRILLRDDFPLIRIDYRIEGVDNSTEPLPFIIEYSRLSNRLLFMDNGRIAGVDTIVKVLHLYDFDREQLLGSIYNQPSSAVADWGIMW